MAFGLKKTTVVSLLLIFFVLNQPINIASAAPSKLSSSQCKQVIQGFRTLVDPVYGLAVSGYVRDPENNLPIGEVKPPISKLGGLRKSWQSLEQRLGSGPLKIDFRNLIDVTYTIITTKNGSGSDNTYATSIYKITKSCLPAESNEFCRTLATSLEGAANLWKGQSLAKSGVLSTKRIWSSEVKKWPATSNSRAWMNRLLTYLDEMISEAKAQRSSSAAYRLFLDEWDNTQRNNEVIDYWPCVDRVEEALGFPKNVNFTFFG